MLGRVYGRSIGIGTKFDWTGLYPGDPVGDMHWSLTPPPHPPPYFKEPSTLFRRPGRTYEDPYLLVVGRRRPWDPRLVGSQVRLQSS
ncbi:hypothetical protein G9A89_000719 [Geosiphon pyriformis]|nr:hypothetical protein G9A89_000719 [Geosiphon pyriformis]